MNPFWLAGPDTESYLAHYWTYLETVIDEVLAHPFPRGAPESPRR